MKTHSINPSLSYDKIHNARNHRNYFIKSYKNIIGAPPILLWFLVLTSFFSLLFLFSSNPFHFSSQNHKLQEQRHQEHHFPRPLIKQQFGDDNCDLFKGKWVPDLNGSVYTTTSCVTIPESKNCFKNGRIDIDFVNWRWKPDDCELPRFDPNKFVKIVSGKKLAFVGDSVARNQFESLLCLLSQAEAPMDVYKDSEDRFRTWHFPSSNFTLMMFWTKFLVTSEERMMNNSGTGSFNLHLDKVDENWASRLPGLDYVIISSAHWFFRKNYLYDQGKLIGCVYCNDPNVQELGLNYSLRMSFRAALKYINDCKGCKNDLVTLIRTFSPAHFENGAWDTGGSCNRTSPHTEEKGKEMKKSFEFELRKLQMEEVERAIKGAKRKLRALDITWAMLMRPDGHPGAFWGNKWMKGYNDCVHWCMPGPIDAWNDLLLSILQKEVGLSS